MSVEIHHAGLSVSDLERSIAFYSLFGLEEVRRVELSGEAFSKSVKVPGAVVRIAAMRGDNALLELLEYTDPTGKPFGRSNNDIGSSHVCFRVDDIDAMARKLEEAGVELNAPPSIAPTEGPSEGIRFSYLSDPDGVTVEIMQAGTHNTHEALGVGSAS
ncbi:MAG: VOC family protein [Actinobacteria bacterium]|nr:VOC family protein [Actinomycetota bacterium]